MNELMRRLLALPEQASTMAFEIDVLHYVVISISILGAVLVAAFVGVMLIRFRIRPGGTPPAGHHRRIPGSVEGIVIVGLLVMFLVFWIVGFRQYVRLKTPPANSMDVYVIAKQWMWTFAYPDGNATNSDLVVPANRPVRLLMTSRDVIHSFYVPDFRVKQDVLPARTTALWFEAKKPGIHDIFCAEYCGTEHSMMRGRVIVLDEAAYAKWAEDTARAGQDLVSKGARIAADRGCLRCHTVDGAPHLGPTWAGVYGSVVTVTNGDRVRVDEAYLTESMMDPERRLRAGFPAIMPSYRGLLDAAEVAALVHYIRSLSVVAPASPPPAGPFPSIPIVEQR